MTTLETLKGNPRNPRRVTAAKLAALSRTLDRFGDLGGIVFNRRSGQLVGGHQRVDVFRQDKRAEVVITERLDPPDKHGTAEEGYVEALGHRFSYRVVDWDAQTEKAANLAANNSVGDWDMPEVASWVEELKASDFDLSLTLFDASQIDMLQYETPGARSGSEAQTVPATEHLAQQPLYAEPVSEMGKARGREAEVDLERFESFAATCPRCKFGFNP